MSPVRVPRLFFFGASPRGAALAGRLCAPPRPPPRPAPRDRRHRDRRHRDHPRRRSSTSPPRHARRFSFAARAARSSSFRCAPTNDPRNVRVVRVAVASIVPGEDAKNLSFAAFRSETPPTPPPPSESESESESSRPARSKLSSLSLLSSSSRASFPLEAAAAFFAALRSILRSASSESFAPLLPPTLSASIFAASSTSVPLSSSWCLY